MSELTKEHFEHVIKGLATKNDLKGLVTKDELKTALSTAVAPLATKAQVEASEQRVIKRIDEAQEELARMVAAGFEDIQDRLDVREQMKAYERKLQRLEEA